MEKYLHIYTDGSCYPNPGGPGGWGIVVVDSRTDRAVASVFGGEAKSTNNRMELMAGIEAIKRCFEHNYANIAIIFSDSQLFVKTYNEWMMNWDRKGIVKDKANPDLVRQLIEMKKWKPMEVRWVKGHSDHRWNDMADELALKGRLSVTKTT